MKIRKLMQVIFMYREYIISAMAIVGFIIILGAVGTSDYMVECGVDYPLAKTTQTMLVGLLLMMPAIIREAL